MKNLTTTVAFTLVCFILACTKEPKHFAGTSAPPALAVAPGQIPGLTNARLYGANYSKPISIDTANMMIQNYLDGVGYPYVDTAIRSLHFDADTLRAYLQDNDIKTIKFMFAQPSGYAGSDPTASPSSLNASALTMIIVGLDDEEGYVLNSSNGVYDNMQICPYACPSSSGALIQ